MNTLYLILTVILFTQALGGYQAQKSKEKDNRLTTWITHLGCFMATFLDENKEVKNITLGNNEPRTCSRQCSNWPYFALSHGQCFCFQNDVFSAMKETVNNKCYSRCPNTDDIVYCGSEDKELYTIYKRDTELEVNGSSNCVARMKETDTLQSVKCDKELQFLCKTRAGVSIKTVKRSFYEAKLYCENAGGRLTIFTENMPHKCEVNVLYWTGTFRQPLKKNFHHEQTTIYPRSSSKSSVVSTTLGYIKHTTSLDSLTTEIQVTKESTIEPITSPNNIDVDTLDAISQKIIDREDTENENALDCGVFCFILGVCLCCVIILALVVCLFKIRQQWNVRVQKNITVTHKSDNATKDKPDDDETKPVYLDPTTQTVVFHKRNLDTVNQHIYDQADIYNQTSQIPVRTNCLSGYQELHFTGTREDKITKDPVLTNDKENNLQYNAPWDIFNARGTGRHVKSEGGEQPKKNTILQTENVPEKELQYEDTIINHKHFLYDEPQIQIEGQQKASPSIVKSKGKLALASDRGFSVGTRQSPASSIKVISSQPDIITHEHMTSTNDDHIYETPAHVLREEFTKTEKPRNHKSRSMISKISSFSKSLRKYRKRMTSVDVDRTYDIPNPVNPSHRFSKSRSVDTTNATSGQDNLMKYPVYELPMSSCLHNRHPNVHSDKTNKIPSQYELAMPIGKNTKVDQLCSEYRHGALQYELALTVKEKHDNVSENEKANVPIYFEPIT